MSNTAEQVYPIDASEKGNNVCMANCRVYGGMRHYAVCLSLINRFEGGAASTYDPDCNRAINEGECPAQGMRAKELAAGRALFYQPREASRFPPMDKNVTIFDRGFQRGYSNAGSRPSTSNPSSRKSEVAAGVTAPVVKPKPAPAPVSSGNDYADLVNKMLKEETAKPAAVVAGGGLLEIARKMRERNAQ